MSNQTTLLSDHDFEAIKAACRNRFNWTDGGHWNGRGKAPNCAVSRLKQQTSSLLIKWPDAEAARRWNDEMARAHRMAGYGLGLLASLVAAWLPGVGAMRGAPAHFRDFALTVAVGEKMADDAPQVVRPHESVKITVQMEYFEPASPLGRRRFTARTTTEWFDPRGVLKAGPFHSVQHYSASNFPMDFAWRLVNQPPAHIVQDY